MRVESTSGEAKAKLIRPSNAVGAAFYFDTTTTNDWILGMRGTTDSDFHLYSYGTGSDVLVVKRDTVNVGIGISPTAVLTLKAGTATASTAPLKFTSGTLNTTAEAGAVEFLTDAFYGTITTGAARKGIVLDD